MSDYKFKYGRLPSGSKEEFIDGIPASYTSKVLSDEDSEELVRKLLDTTQHLKEIKCQD